MTDIERLRENVINAARAWRSEHGEVSLADGLFEALDALDAALTPDPWAVLEESLDRHANDLSAKLETRIREALEWREANP